ncbi:MAG: hypothetical protein OXU20_28880 [Myxococcales bacterium]|nr:hypothetical protein [Myxococcales bacterium]
MKPTCFMVMPFRTKTVTGAGDGAPAEVDCDRLWDAVFRPLFEELGYQPVRADFESSSVIVKDMLNRLKHADLVVADMSLPNGNVYYELGIRHVAQGRGCVQVAADWFRPLFDIKDFRTLTYPLTDGSVPDAEAQAIRERLAEPIRAFCEEATPYHRLVDFDAKGAFQREAQRIADFQAQLSRVRLTRAGDRRQEQIDAIVKQHGDTARLMPGVALELVYLLRDAIPDPDRVGANFRAVRDFVESLPDNVRRTETVEEQYLLAQSNLGEHEQAIAGLRELNTVAGETTERLGLVGGSFKRLYRHARKQRVDAGEEEPSFDERDYLEEAIEAYDRGRQLDLNEYYCACNLPALLRERGEDGDAERAAEIDVQVLAACQRAKDLGTSDDWLDHTLLGAAFRSGNIRILQQAVKQVERGAGWQLASTLTDAVDWIAHAPEEARSELNGILKRLERAAKQ